MFFVELLFLLMPYAILMQPYGTLPWRARMHFSFINVITTAYIPACFDTGTPDLSGLAG
jgi:hypothetical protein